MNYSLAAVFGAGLLTFASPCVLPLIPIIIANLAATKATTPGARFRSTALFVAGFTAAFTVLGLGLPALTNLLSAFTDYLFLIAGILLFLFGLKMLGFFPVKLNCSVFDRTFSLPDLRRFAPESLHAPILGFLFGFTWTPCVGPILAGVLAYTASAAGSKYQGALMLFTFSMGIGLPLLVVAAALERITPLLNSLKRSLPRIELASGAVLLLFGLYLIKNSAYVIIPGAHDAAVARVTTDSGTSEILGSKDDSLRMIYFHSADCSICREIDKYLPDFERQCSSESFRVLAVDIDAPQNRRAVKRYNIKGVPTIALLDKSGLEVARFIGYQERSVLEEAARKAGDVVCRPWGTSAPSAITRDLSNVSTDKPS